MPEAQRNASTDAREVETPAEFAGERRWETLDWALLAGVLLFCATWVWQHFVPSAPPVEDAAMLLRYAEHFAAGHGVRWNVDMPPVDGATDFLYMAAIGALARAAHISVIAASRVLNLAAHGLSVALVFAGGRKLFGANRWLCAWLACYVAADLATNMATGCFGAPFFALWLLLAWMAGLRYVLRRASWGVAMLSAACALLAGLTRPEGVLISAMMLAAFLHLGRSATPRIDVKPLAISFLLLFATIGGAYFVWRWRYFGYPLPNPFYIKGDGHLYPSSLRHAASYLTAMLAPVLVLIPLGWACAATRRLTNALLIVLVPFTLMWLLLSNENNHFMRFQYAVVPLTVLTIAGLGGSVRAFGVRPMETWGAMQKAAAAAAGFCALSAAVLYLAGLRPFLNTSFGMREFALRLEPLAARGYTMVVTEAGALPLYSQWRTIDAIGLNDATIAHHGLTEAYLDQFHPEIILVHIDTGFPEEFASGFTAPPGNVPGLYKQELLDHYATTHHYTLAAVYGSSPCNLHLYWVRPGFADYDQVLSDIRDHPYYFLDNGALAFDYRNSLDALKACATPVP